MFKTHLPTFSVKATTGDSK